jgi:glutamyl-tRNA synthetase
MIFRINSKGFISLHFKIYKTMERKVRVRFAPSPTGPLHIGGVRTALYNYLFAKKHQGDFLLRIEDTDQGRYVPGAEEYIIESLNWCGINFDEGVGKGGPHAPYRQSERKEIYRQYAEFLIKNGKAYYAFDSAEELDKCRKDAEAAKQTFLYGFASRNQLRNSIVLGETESQKLIDAGTPYVVRVLIPENEEVTVNDLIRGTVTFHSSQLDDKVLFKSDGMPTYHLANVVDDYLMEISHVIRGEEWLPSAPLHVLLYRYLGWESQMPEFAHLPLLLKPDGKGKLSKRDGDKLGFPVFPLLWTDPKTGEISSGYRESGYLPDAFVNMLAFLGWNPGTEQEIFSMEEMVNAFSLERVGKSGSKFDPEKTRWFNHQYIQVKPNEELLPAVNELLKTHSINADQERLLKIIGLVKHRINLMPDFIPQTIFFFQAPQNFDEKAIKDKWKPNSGELVQDLKSVISGLSDFTAESLKEAVHHHIETSQIGMGQVMNALRICLVGSGMGPDLMEIIELLGKEEVLKRIDFALCTIKVR